MEVKFSKYQGTGNDFIMINNMDKKVSLSQGQIQFLCDRKLGVGADGVILIEPHESADFYVNYFNSDGSQSFCGNGSRCSVAYSKTQNIFSGNKCSFSAIDGIHKGQILDDRKIKVSMGDVFGVEDVKGDFVLDTGSPHYVQLCDDISNLDILTKAHEIRYNERFSESGINVNFVQNNNGSISMRTYERGVENETLSCGTGVTAVALSMSNRQGNQEVKIRTQGGELFVSFHANSDQFTNVSLTGPVVSVYKGLVDIEK